MKWTCSSKCHHYQVTRIVTSLKCGDSQSICHLGICDLYDPICTIDDIHFEGFGAPLANPSRCGFDVKRHLPTQEKSGAQSSQDNVGIGDRRLLSAISVTNRTRISTRTMRTHSQNSAGINPCNAAASGTNLYQIYYGSADRITASAKLADSGKRARAYFVLLSDPGASLQNETDFCRGSPHVKRNDILVPKGTGNKTRYDNPGCRSRFDHVYGLFRSSFKAEDATIGLHDQ